MSVYHRLTCCFLISTFLMVSGCRNMVEWRQNGFKVGPDYAKPSAQTNEDWVANQITEEKDQVNKDADFDTSRETNQQWWRVFNDPVLDQLIEEAYQHNLDVKAAVYRVAQAAYIKQIAAGNLFPQSQFGSGAFQRQQFSNNIIQFPGFDRINDTWTRDLNLSWEIDFWGRIRRNIAAADASLDATIEDLDAVLVTLVAEVASTYMEIRSVDQRLAYAIQNAEIQRQSLQINETKKKFEEINRLDVDQAMLNLKQTEAAIPQLRSSRRQLQNRLSVLLGLPPADLTQLLGEGNLPSLPETVVVGIPADLLRRRPDVRAAERILASQSEQIGIATAELYPTFTLVGSLGLQSQNFADLFESASATGLFSPGFQWNILNYGRILNRIKAEGAGFMELVANYQKAVLTAQQETEDAMAGFIYAKRAKDKLKEAEIAATSAVELGRTRRRLGDDKLSYNQIFVLEANLVRVQDSLVQAELEVVQNLIRLYRSLGGGWEVRDMFECLPAVDYEPLPDCYDPKCLPDLCETECLDQRR